MPASGVTNTQIYYAAGALVSVVLLIGGGKVAYDHTETGITNSAFALSKKCQQLKRIDKAKYTDCQIKLNLSLKKLKDKGLFDADKCKPWPEDEAEALCPLKSGVGLIVTLPEIVAYAKTPKNGVTKRSVDQAYGVKPLGSNLWQGNDRLKRELSPQNYRVTRSASDKVKKIGHKVKKMGNKLVHKKKKSHNKKSKKSKKDSSSSSSSS